MAQGQVNPRLLSRKTQHGLTGVLNEHAAVPAAQSGGFGARMLAKFGWKDGEGLGKDGQGRKEHIRVTKRAEGLGLGASAAEPSEWAPPPGSAAAAASAKRSRDSDSDSDEEDEREAEVRRRVASSGVIPGLSDEDLFAICGGARLGMRARADQGGKLKRMELADRAAAEAMKRAAPGSATAAAATAATSSGTPRQSPRLQALAATGNLPSLDLAPKASRDDLAPKASRDDATAEARAAAKAAQRAARKAEKKAARKAARKAEKKAAKNVSYG